MVLMLCAAAAILLGFWLLADLRRGCLAHTLRQVAVAAGLGAAARLVGGMVR